MTPGVAELPMRSRSPQGLYGTPQRVPPAVRLALPPQMTAQVTAPTPPFVGARSNARGGKRVPQFAASAPSAMPMSTPARSASSSSQQQQQQQNQQRQHRYGSNQLINVAALHRRMTNTLLKQQDKLRQVKVPEGNSALDDDPGSCPASSQGVYRSVSLCRYYVSKKTHFL